MTAAMLGELRPLVHRFMLGSFEVTTVLDGAMIRDGLTPPFGVNQEEQAVRALARRNLFPDDRFEHTFTPTLVYTGEELVLFDVGNGSGRRPGNAGLLRERLALAGYRPEDIDIVAFTYLHPDHIGGVREGDALAYPNARYVIGRAEFDGWISGDRIPPGRAQNRDQVRKLILPLAERASFIEPGQDIVAGIRAVEAFGHSVGHLNYMIESAGAAMLVWGDVTNHYVLSLQNPDWHFAIDDDREQAAVTRKRILEMVATERILAVGHHMPFPAVGYVMPDGAGYRWLPASYQLRLPPCDQA